MIHSMPMSATRDQDLGAWSMPVMTIDLGSVPSDVLAEYIQITCSVQSSEKEIEHPRRQEARGDIPSMKDKTTPSRSSKESALSRAEQARVAEACLEHAVLIETLANQHYRPGCGHEVGDLIQIGRLALAKSLRDWRPDGGASFVTIANGDIRNAMRAAVPASRRDRYTDVEGRGRPEPKFRNVLLKAMSIFKDSDGDDENCGDTIIDELSSAQSESDTESEFLKAEELALLKDAVLSLSNEDRRLIRLWSENDGNVTEVADALALPLHRRSITRKVEAALVRLKDAYDSVESGIELVNDNVVELRSETRQAA